MPRFALLSSLALLSACFEAPTKPTESAARCEDHPPPEDAACSGCDALGLVRVGPSEDRAAYRIVFVPVGQSDDDLATFATQVETIAAELRNDPRTIVGRRPELFELSRATRAVRSDDGTWPCGELGGGEGRSLVVPRAITKALLEHMAGRTVVVEVADLDGDFARANSDNSAELAAKEGVAVRIAKTDGAGVLDHELGHAIIGLGDEYTDAGASGCYPHAMLDLPEGAPQPYPNLSAHADGRDWGGLVSGAEPGGEALYDRCIYHPTNACRMLHSAHAGFCPVCQNAIDHALAHAAGDEPLKPPSCVVTSTRDEKEIHVRVVGWTDSPPILASVGYSNTSHRHEVSSAWGSPTWRLVDHRIDISLDGLELPIDVSCDDASGLPATTERITE